MNVDAPVPPLSIPRLVVAAPASGAGKTTIATGLMAAFTARGLRVSPHKVGPDYIDPTYHALATGRPGRNLDAVLCGAPLVGPLFAHGARGADVAVVEGVMGLFDGVSSPAAEEEPDHASTAHVARLLDAPVVLVVDARGAGRSVAALVHGFVGWDPRVRLAGVILNRVGSDRHEQVLRAALAASGVTVFGALGRDDAVTMPSRHLGLVPVAERHSAAGGALARLAALVVRGIDVDGLLALARSAAPLPVRPWDPAEALAGQRRRDHSLSATGPMSPGALMGPGVDLPSVPADRRDGDPLGPVRVAVAAGPAFTFTYPEQSELLRAAGAEVHQVDPLRDERLPVGTDALIVGGGFPEEHAEQLAANVSLRAEVAALARRGAPVAAECAGLLYLAETVDGTPMCGVLPLAAEMTDRLTLGYRKATAVADSPVAAAGATVRAHEFHRTVVRATRPGTGPAWRIGGGVEGLLLGGVHASYLHLHWAGGPAAATRFVAAARAGRAVPGRSEPGSVEAGRQLSGGRRTPVTP
ncbi:MAG: cobyrinate a,c-diamide synthase [Frankia sp.]